MLRSLCTALVVSVIAIHSAWAATSPAISVSDVTVAAPGAATFVVTLSAPSSKPVTVHYRTADGSATAPGDYQPTAGTLTFAPGETSKTVTVRVKVSPVPAAEKVFYLQLFKPSDATISRPQGTATIVDNLPTIALPDTFIAEPPPGEINRALFTVSLSFPSSRPVSVHFTTADGSAVAGEDFEPLSGILTFRPGEASKTISIDVRNDLISSPDGIFWLKLFNPSNAQLARAAGQATIVDSDRIVSISDTAILQPPPGAEAVALFQVVLSEPTSGSTQPAAGFPGSVPASVDFTTADGSAVAGEDYVPLSGTLLFRPGESVKTISVPVRNNGVPGFDRAFLLRLSNPVNARLARALGTAVIVATNRTVTIEDTATTDTDAPGNVANFVVSVSGASTEPVTVRYATADGTARAGVDYVAQSGTVVFGPGEISARITVPILSDLSDENPGTPETFFVDLVDAQNAEIARPRATGAIFDNDRFISVADTSLMADPVAPLQAVVTLALTEAPSTPVRVAFTTADGTATAPADYQQSSGTVTFAAGETTATITIPVSPQPSEGPDKTFYVRLSGGANGRILRGEAIATIVTRGRGYWLVGADGGIFSLGATRFMGSTGGTELNQPIVGMAPTPSGNGYWLAAADGGVFTFGDAGFFGSTGAVALKQPIVGMAATPSGNGYWLVAADGGIFAFGDAGFFGSTGAVALNQPIVGMAATPSGNGYWFVASDGGVFAFGDARFFGSPTGHPNAPVVAMAATPSGKGYWLVGSDGGVFAFGDAGFFGSATAADLKQPIIGMAPTPNGKGYWLVAMDGGIFALGDARFFGSTGALTLNHPIVGMARRPH